MCTQCPVTPALGGIWKRPQLHPKLCLAGILTGGDVRKERFTQRTELRSIIDSWRHFCLVWGAKVSHWTSAEGELHQVVRQKKLQSGAFSIGPHASPQVGGYLKNRKEERPNVQTAFLMDPSVVEKKEESLPFSIWRWISKGYLVCDLLFMLIIRLALSLGNYFYSVHLIA